MLCSIKLPNFLVWLPLPLDTLGKVCIVIVCFPGCDARNFESKLTFNSILIREYQHESTQVNTSQHKSTRA